MNSPETHAPASGISRFELSSPVLKIFFLGLCLLLIGVYTYRVLRSYVASRYAAKVDWTSLQRAARLEPGNALYADRLGRFLSFVQQDASASLAPYLQAVHLNPHEAQYWLDLASAHQFTGNTVEQGRALENAVRVDPRTPAIAWQTGNYLLLQGQTQQALKQFRVVVENDPQQADAAIDLSWRATHDAAAIIKDALPPEPQAHLRLLRLLVAQDQAATAKKVWAGVAELHQPIDPKSAFPYLDYCVARHDVDEAARIWDDLLRNDRQLQPYSVADDMVVNGGFEETILNGGFDWRYQRSASVSVSIDSSTVHSGLRSFALDFNGNRQDPGIFQLVPVQPDTEYEFSGYMKSEALDGANGPRFSVSDAFDNTSYVLTGDLLGSSAWRHMTGTFKTSKDARLVTIAVVQVPANTHLSGRVWIDDVSLKKK